MGRASLTVLAAFVVVEAGCSEDDHAGGVAAADTAVVDATDAADAADATDGLDGDVSAPDATDGSDTEIKPEVQSGDTAETGDAPPAPTATWTQQPLGLGEDFVLKGLWAAGPEHLVAVGNKATVIERVDGVWSVVHQNTTDLDTLNAVWGSSPTDVWAVGAYGALLHRGKEGWAIGTGCSGDAACDDGDACTIDTCSVDGACAYSGSGAAGCCGTVSYSENWDTGGLGSWTVVDTSVAKTGVVWNNAANVDRFSGAKRATSGANALYFGNPVAPCFDDPKATCPNFEAFGATAGSIVSSTATSASITLPKGTKVTVNFSVFIDTEAASGWDILELRVKPAGAATPITVWTKDDVGGITEKLFVDTQADLSKFAGQSVTLQWFFDSADTFANDGEGVYIDSLTIDSVCGAETGARFPTLFGVFGFASDNVYAVGNGGAILHFDGTSWKQQVGGEEADLFTVGGTKDALVIGGSDGQILSSLGGGGVSAETAIQGTVRGVAALSDGRVVAVGDTGVAAVYGTGSWTPTASGVSSDLHAIWSAGATALAVGAGGTVLRFDGSSFTSEGGLVTTTLYGIWGNTDEVWAVGEKGTVLHHGGAGWESQPLTALGGGAGSELRDIIGFPGSDELVAVGGLGTIAERKGGVWEKAPSPASYTLHGVWGANPTDVWAVGNAGLLVHRVGDKWEKLEAPVKTSLFGVWGRSSSDVYAVGAGGALMHFDGTAWSLLRSSTAEHLRAVWGPSPNDVFAVGVGPTAMHFDGLFWSLVEIKPDILEDGSEQPITDPMFDVAGDGKDEVFAVGEDGTVLRLVREGGLAFERLQVEPSPTLRAISFAPDGTAFFVGREGTVLTYGASTGRLVENSGTIATLYDVVAFPDGEVVVVGERGTVLERHAIPPAE